MEKHENASRFALTDRNHPILSRPWPLTPICADPVATVDRGSRGGHLRSNELTIHISPISRDRMDIETRKWCQTTWLV